MQISKELIQRCIKEDRKGQLELYKTCYSILMRVCIRYEHNEQDAIALLNMGFLKICKSLDKYQEKVPFEAWIRRIMINTVIDEYRKNKEHNKRTEYIDFQESGVPPRHVEYNEADLAFDAKDLRDMIKQLPPISQKVFNLYVVDGYSHKEISEILGISGATSRWHLSNSRTMIKKMIGKLMRITDAIAV